MVEELKQLIGMVEKLTEATLWVLGGLAFYKLIIVGAVLFIARLVIERAYSLLSKPKEVSLEDIFITHDGTFNAFKFLLKGLRRPGWLYLTSDEVSWIGDAIKEKKERETKK
jgi:hypothetical protein